MTRRPRQDARRIDAEGSTRHASPPAGPSAAERAIDRAVGEIMQVISVLTIRLPYCIYRVPVEHWRAQVFVDLSKNSQLRTGAMHQERVRMAKRQMAQDTEYLLRATGWPEMRTPLTISAVITTRTAGQRDDDGVWVGLYPARDAIARHLAVDDSDMRTGAVTFKKGMPEETEITVRSATKGGA